MTLDESVIQKIVDLVLSVTLGNPICAGADGASMMRAHPATPSTDRPCASCVD